MLSRSEIEIRPIFEYEDFGDAITPKNRLSRKSGCGRRLRGGDDGGITCVRFATRPLTLREGDDFRVTSCRFWLQGSAH